MSQVSNDLDDEIPFNLNAKEIKKNVPKPIFVHQEMSSSYLSYA